MVKIIEFNVDDWDVVIEESYKPVVVEFWHNKCPACEKMKPIYEKISEEMADSIKFTKMNLLERRENRKHAIQIGVRSTPTFMIFCNGILIGSLVGIYKKEDLKDQIKKIINNKEFCLMATPL
jgi:thioredoxin-like negative regulator of GroEL